MISVDILLKARDYIADKERWCQGTSYVGDKACALGSVYKLAPPQDGVEDLPSV